MDNKSQKNNKHHHRQNRSTGVVMTNRQMGTAAALDSSALGEQTVDDAIPSSWEDRAVKAWQYYVEEPIVQNAINSWRTFAIGDEIQINCNDEDVKAEAREFAEDNKINTLVKDAILQCLVKGECVCFKRYNAEKTDIDDLVCVNPVSIKVKYENGKLIEMKQYPETTGGEPIDLPLDQVIHIKWNAPSFSQRGNSMVVTAFNAIELLRDYRKAERAVAKRWTTPLRFIQVGGQYGQKTIIPDQKTLNTVRDMINKMDLKAGLVVPFYVKAETYGTEGQVLNTEKKIGEIKDDIMIALGLAKSLITGDGPNFATASIAMQKMIVMLKEIKQAARNILNWIFRDWLELKGYDDKKINYIFNDLDLTNEVDLRKLYIELYDRKLISKNSLQIKMDLNPESEIEKREQESSKPIEIIEPKVIVDMVNAGIMSIETAQEKLGLDKEKNRPTTAAWDYGPPMVTGNVPGDAVCDDCRFFEDETNFCESTGTETRFDARACGSFIEKRKKA